MPHYCAAKSLGEVSVMFADKLRILFVTVRKKNLSEVS